MLLGNNINGLYMFMYTIFERPWILSTTKPFLIPLYIYETTHDDIEFKSWAIIYVTT